MSRRIQVLMPVAIVVATGCATLAHGPQQRIPIGTIPWGAKVTVDGQPSGTTPMMVVLSRRSEHRIMIELPGYQPFETTLRRKVSGWEWANFLAAPAGLIGVVIDAGTGALFALTPDEVTARLGSTAPGGGREPGVFFGLVSNPDPRWAKIGTLERR